MRNTEKWWFFEVIGFLSGKFWGWDAHWDFVLVDVYLWKGNVQQEVYQLISFVDVLLRVDLLTALYLAAFGTISFIDQIL